MGLKTRKEKLFMKAVGARIKKLRRVAGISYSEMTGMADLPYNSSSLGGWEAGRQCIPLYRLALIAKGLNVSVSFLIEDIDL